MNAQKKLKTERKNNINILTIPWPDSALNPNSRNKWKTIAARKKQRSDCYYIAKSENPFTGNKIHLEITFHPPDKRNRDLDNCLSMLKGALDGLCDAWNINDTQFNPITIQWGCVIKYGKVEIKQIKN